MWPAQEKHNWHWFRSLIEAWPDSICVPDHEGYLLCPHKVLTDEKDSSKTIEFLIKSFPEPQPVMMCSGILPLHWACYADYAKTQVIWHLVGLDPLAVRILDHQKWLPLHIACKAFDLAAISFPPSTYQWGTTKPCCLHILLIIQHDTKTKILGFAISQGPHIVLQWHVALSLCLWLWSMVPHIGVVVE